MALPKALPKKNTTTFKAIHCRQAIKQATLLFVMLDGATETVADDVVEFQTLGRY